MTNPELLGRKVFAFEGYDPERGINCIYEITAVLPPHHDMEDMGERMRLKAVASDYEGEAHWISEIGKEFHLIPKGYLPAELAFFAQWCEDKARASNVEIDLTLHAEGRGL